MDKPTKPKFTRDQRVAVAVGIADLAVRAVALVDLARRPAEQVLGSKAAWAACLVIFNGLGAPATYFLIGRRRAAAGQEPIGTVDSS